MWYTSSVVGLFERKSVAHAYPELFARSLGHIRVHFTITIEPFTLKILEQEIKIYAHNAKIFVLFVNLMLLQILGRVRVMFYAYLNVCYARKFNATSRYND